MMRLDWMCLVLEFAEGEVSGGGHEEGGTPQRNGGAKSCNDLRSLVFLDKDMVEDVQH
jgi:hypothetical protein